MVLVGWEREVEVGEVVGDEAGWDWNLGPVTG